MPVAVVTGGAGFVGSHLCGRLLDDGFDVVAVDSLLTGAVENLAEFSADRSFSFVDADVSHCIDMLFGAGHKDVAGYAAALPLDHEPGTVWSYSSGTTNVLARLIGDAVGGPVLLDEVGMLDRDVSCPLVEVVDRVATIPHHTLHELVCF